MKYKDMLKAYYYSISNEICLDKEFLNRENTSVLSFTPVRSIKTIALVKKYKINIVTYSFLALVYFVFSPVFFLKSLMKNIIKLKKNKNSNIHDNVVLVANRRVEYLYSKIKESINTDTTFLSINRVGSMHSIPFGFNLNLFDLIKAYMFSIVSMFYILIKLRNKTDIIQTYVAYEWFMTYISLSKIKKDVKNVYFANHYDRWATLFEQLFYDKEVNLIQHGILPNNLSLVYKFKNIDKIYCYNNKSEVLFKKLFNAENIIFERVSLSINLSEIKSRRKTMLIIGQPHCIEREIEIVKKLYNDFMIYIKPHPLYQDSAYYKVKGCEIIKDKNYYPKVDLALSYESTLGMEYEASGITVLWWKELKVDEVVHLVKNIMDDKL
ncbi:hypothetical protein [Francisella frigiditurris]|uniref:Glycosyltransferase 52 family protein n=1 Tax=Francisella frigiditurris TaxID=1542390 RepID=A0A1J0KU14_9GAMM|nr:hypothetical protein [Francisella frigiditurris]APC97241.1 hypothetical protein KX01_1738 [Francisella frigiditurris]